MAALEREGRDPTAFDYVGQVVPGTTRASRREAVGVACRFVDAGASHVILGMQPTLGPAGLDAIAAECLAPLRDRLA